jgi:hypothetical protein
MEYLAVTTGDAIPTGATIVVTGVVGADTVEVEPVQTVETNQPQVGHVPA